MSIDRIGKGGGIGNPASTGSAPTAPTGGTGQVFEVRTPDQAHAPETVAQVTAAQTPLERLRAGQIDLPAYMDLKIEHATAHLKGLAPSELGAIRRMLREQLASDPALVDLVKGATGQMPIAQDE